ncbi:MAG TPA: outer membrane lipoprotein carrier protein LolA [Stellaceae bacterium]|nr:outer membrane lipoprotein carrier protein LolA [Stellaceae bacterium]
MTKIAPSPLTRRAALAFVAAAALAPRIVRAAPPAGPRPAQLDAAGHSDVMRVQQYLNGIRTMQSRFEQVADDGGVAAGTIYMQRPGQMRIVYDPPSPILIVATSGQIYYYDSRLNQVSRTYVTDTPAWFLLRDPIQLFGDITVTDFRRAADTLRLTLVETKDAGLGQVTVALSDQPLQLRQWTVLDAQRKQVTVTLQNPQFGMPLNANLFYWTDPRPDAHP